MARTIELPLTDLLTLTVKEAASLAGLDRERLDEAIRMNSLKVLKIDGVRRVYRPELDRWLQSLIVPLEALGQ
jgi:excisionase family DNA binding protein